MDPHGGRAAHFGDSSHFFVCLTRYDSPSISTTLARLVSLSTIAAVMTVSPKRVGHLSNVRLVVITVDFESFLFDSRLKRSSLPS